MTRKRSGTIALGSLFCGACGGFILALIWPALPFWLDAIVGLILAGAFFERFLLLEAAERIIDRE